MKLAIQHRQGSFSERWIDYCKKNSINYMIVNAFDSDIIKQVKGCDAFMWHHHHAEFKDVLTAKRIIYALEHAGIAVFPNINTSWHFDDKVAQKYLLEAIDAPIVPSYVFYDKAEAVAWAKNTSYPKVFKLKGGAGAKNVKLVKSYREAKMLIYKAFGKGFPQFDKIGNLKERFNRFRHSQDSLSSIFKGLGRLVLTPEFSQLQSNEVGYAYFQDFIPNDGFDIRVVVIGNKAIALKRLVRKNDFRASGSGNLVFENESIDKRYIKLAFDINKKLGSQSLAIDLIHSKEDEIFVVELSYGFPMLNFLDNASGYWDNEINWHESHFNPQEWIIENIDLSTNLLHNRNRQ